MSATPALQALLCQAFLPLESNPHPRLVSEPPACPGLSPVLNALVPAPSPNASLAIRATHRPTQGWSEINISSVRCAWGGSTPE